MTKTTRKTKRLLLISLLLGSIPASIFGQSVLDKLKAAATQTNQNNTPPKAAATATQASKAQAASAKVETLVLAPSAAGMVIYVSPHGGHLAGVRQKGSRFVVLHDGVDGPMFDDIVQDQEKRWISFSPDGTRYLYVGRAGQEYVVMVDGKELARLPVSTAQYWWTNAARAQLQKSLPAFTSNSKHVYFGISADKGSGEQSRFFFDGKPATTRWPKAKALVLSPDGDHYVYISSGSSSSEYELIVDGKPAGYQGGSPQFTADSSHLFTKTQTANGQGVEILVDGKQPPVIRAQDANLYFPPAGNGVVAVVSQRSAGGDIDKQFLVIGGKKIDASEAARIQNVYFSPDGKHYAAECESKIGTAFMVVDGKKGQEYQSIYWDTVSPKFVFSADSTRTAYIATSGGKNFAVIDGLESEGYANIEALVFAGQGQRVGFVGFNNGSTSRFVVIDGKATPRNFASSDLRFSPDGSRYAYTFTDSSGAGSSSMRLVADGVAEEGVAVVSMTGKEKGGTKFLFSPDGKHIVHYGYPITDRTKRGFYIDGKFVPDPGNALPWNPTFTPDGRHLVWFSEALNAAGRVSDYVIFVDGRPAAKVDPDPDTRKLLTSVAGGWEMGGDGALTFIGYVGADIQRIRITPSNDTSIDTMLASARAK